MELEPGAVYEVFLDVDGGLGETRAGTAAIRLAVDSPLPEPGAGLRLAIGALVLAFAGRRGAATWPGPRGLFSLPIVQSYTAWSAYQCCHRHAHQPTR